MEFDARAWQVMTVSQRDGRLSLRMKGQRQYGGRVDAQIGIGPIAAPSIVTFNEGFAALAEVEAFETAVDEAEA